MEKNRSLKNNRFMFEKWFDRFSHDDFYRAFCDPNWSYFFQFVSNNQREDQFIKLYIPIDYEHLYEGANILFDYIKTLGAKTFSKISQNVRSDNVIVRLKKDDYYNALKIINFVNSNEYLKSGEAKKLLRVDEKTLSGRARVDFNICGGNDKLRRVAKQKW